MTNLQVLREILQRLTYAEMMAFAGWFADADKDPETLGDAAFWAFIISDWVDNVDLSEDQEPTQ